MTQQQSVESLIGMQVRDTAGDKVGKIGQVWVNEATGRPAWASVRTGMFGSAESFVPLDDRCHVEQDQLRVPFDKEMVKDAPRIEADGDLSVSQQDELYRYYRMEQPAGAGTRGGTGTAGTAGTTGAGAAGAGAGAAGAAGAAGTKPDRSRAGAPAMGDRTRAGAMEDRSRTGGPGAMEDRSRTGGVGAMDDRPTTESAGARRERHQSADRTMPAADPTMGKRSGQPTTAGRHDDMDMIRSEERLRVGSEMVETGRVRLRKHVVTEHVETTVPVRHEEVRVEHEPISDATGVRGDISEDQREVILHEERPVVDTETVPVERVRLDTEMVTEQRTVGGDVRKERIDVDDSTDTKPGAAPTTGEGDRPPRHAR